MRKRILAIFFTIFMAVNLSGCGQTKKRPAPLVSVKPVEEQVITNSIESPGRITAKYTTNLVARVSGYLQKRYFKEGDNVSKGSLLFLIEPNEYAIAVRQAQANLRQAQAEYINNEKNLKRVAELVKNDYVSKSEYDSALAKRDASRASVDTYRAALAAAQLNLSYTRVIAPTDGKIGKIMITEGNYVTANSGTLATLVSVNPIYVEFNIKSEDYLDMKKGSYNQMLKNIKSQIKLTNGEVYPEIGVLEFINNEVDPSAGTIKLRATFKNKDQALIPGDFVTVVSTVGKPYSVRLIPEEAVLSGAQGKFVYVLSENNTAKVRPVAVSRIYKDYWVVDKGLEIGEKVIYSGLTSLKPDSPVQLSDKTSTAQGGSPVAKTEESKKGE